MIGRAALPRRPIFCFRVSLAKRDQFRMKASASNTPLSPDEFQRQLTDFVRQHFQHGAKSEPEEVKPAEQPPSAEGTAPSKKAEDFEFKYKPHDVKDYLDRFVIKQDEAKKVLSVA